VHRFVCGVGDESGGLIFFGLILTFGEAALCFSVITRWFIQATWTIRMRRRSKFARPYMERFDKFQPVDISFHWAVAPGLL